MLGSRCWRRRPSCRPPRPPRPGSPDWSRSPPTMGCVRDHRSWTTNGWRRREGGAGGRARVQGVTCVQRHGGDATTDDLVLAMDPRGLQGQARGRSRHRDVCALPQRRGVHAGLCAARARGPGCRRQDERARAAPREGRSKVATCISCYGAHGIRRVSDAQSPVFLPERREDVRPVPRRRRLHEGVHARKRRAAADRPGRGVHQEHPLPDAHRGQRSPAPTCNDCHGNHGAAPPGVESVANAAGPATPSFRAVSSRACTRSCSPVRSATATTT